MFEISFQIGGKKVNPNNIGNALEKAMLEGVKESVTRSASSIRCPKHGSYAKVTAVGSSFDNLSMKITGCCDKLIDTVKLKLH